MSTQENVQIVKDYFAAMGGSDRQALLALVAEDIEWIVPGDSWPLAGTHRGHTGLRALLQKASESVEMAYPKPPEFVAQGDRVLVVGSATGKIKATNKAFKDDWVFDITVRNGKLKSIRSGPIPLNSSPRFLSGVSADAHAASLPVGSITA
jgi:ketosteroid isomerase-like protein